MSLSAQEWLEEHKPEMISDLCQLIEIPSVSSETYDPAAPYGKPCLNVLEKALQYGSGYGFAISNYQNHCGSIDWGAESNKDIGIWCHLDVVPAGDGWSYFPYQPTVKNDIVIGRGSRDNKGPMMAALYAMRYLKDSGYNPSNHIHLFLGCNEETNMGDIKYYLSKYKEPDFSIVPDINFPVCIGEKGRISLRIRHTLQSEILQSIRYGVAHNQIPSTAEAILKLSDEAVARLRDTIRNHQNSNKLFDLIQSDKDPSIFTVTTHGIARHSAFPEGSINAAFRLIDLLCTARILEPSVESVLKSDCTLFSDYYGKGCGINASDQISGRLTIAATMGVLKNGYFYQYLDIRYNVLNDYQKITGALLPCLNQSNWEIIECNDNPSYYYGKSDITDALLKICEEYFHAPQSAFTTGGGTYARKLHHAVGFGASMPDEHSAFGPDRGGAHQPDEYVDIQDLMKACEIYIDSIPVLDRLV